ncbi:MAG TPA: hypothetical protein VFT52_03475 [Luteimonas sp.]|jgi:hypothetical protein|nr:hypothetical protein [Luteimonas sp.]
MNDTRNADAAADRLRKRNRGLLLLIFALFFGSMLVAGALRFSGWRPAGMKNKGELLQPPVDLRARAPRLADGATYAWNPGARQWRILAVPPAACAQACDTAARDLDLLWRSVGHDADKVDVLWLCAEAGCTVPAPLRDDRSLRVLAPDAALREALPGGSTAGVPVYVVDPNGFVILRYAPGSDLMGVREDLSKLLKLI